MLLQYLIWSAVTIVAYMFLKNRKHSNTSNPIMPGLKLRSYSFYGILEVFPSYSTMKRMSLPSTACLGNIFSGLATIFRNDKIICTSAAFQKIIILTKAESVEEYVCSNALVTKPYMEVLVAFFGNGLFTSIGEKWKSRKKMFANVFNNDILKESVRIFDKKSKILVDILKRKHRETWIDIIDPVNRCSMDIVCETFLGFNLEAQDKDVEFLTALQRCTKAIVERVMNPILRFEIIFRFSSIGRQFNKDVRYIRTFTDKIIRDAIDARRILRNKGNSECSDQSKTKKVDAAEILYDFHENNQDISDTEYRDEVISLIFAGADTTASGLAWMLYLIGLYPNIQRKIHEELEVIFGDDHDRPVAADDLKMMNYLECVLKESLRIYPTVPYNVKYALEDFDLCGYKIKKGNIIIIDYYELHRDPNVFPYPEIFDPDRFLPENCAGRSPFAYLPFSAGRRACIGQRYAVMELKTVVANILRNFSIKSLDQRDKIVRSAEIVLRSPRPLKLKFTPRVACANSHDNSGFKKDN